MKINCVVVMCNIFITAIAYQIDSESDFSGLELEADEQKIVIEDKKKYIRPIDTGKVIGEAKKIADIAAKVLVHNDHLRRKLIFDKHAKFTDFITHFIKILQKYDDNDLRLFVTIVDDELRKYHYKGCKFHELIDKESLRKSIAKHLDIIKKMEAEDIRNILAAIASKIKQKNYNKYEKQFVDFINSLYREDSVDKFNTILQNIDDYRLKSRKDMDLAGMLRDGIRSVIFDHYTGLNRNARIAFKEKVDELWNYVIGVSSSYIVQRYLNSLKFPDTSKVLRHESALEISSDDTIEDQTTMKKMQVESHLDLPPDPYSYKNFTAKLYSKVNSSKIHNSTSEPRTLRDLYLESLNLKYLRHNETKPSKVKRTKKSKLSGNSLKSSKKKRSHIHSYKQSTLRQLYLKSINSNSTSHDSTDSSEHDRKFSHLNEFKLFNTTKTQISRQIYIESMNAEDKIHNNFKDKIIYLNADKDNNFVKNINVLKSTDKPSNFRKMNVKIMNLIYDPKPSTVELINTKNMTATSITHNHRAEKLNKLHKKHIRNNMFIDIDPKFAKQMYKKTTKKLEYLRQKEKGNKRLVKVIRSQYGKTDLDKALVIETWRKGKEEREEKEQLSQKHKPAEQSTVSMTVNDLKEAKNYAVGKPTPIEIIEKHNAIIHLNTAVTYKSRRKLGKHNSTNQSKRQISIFPGDKKVLRLQVPRNSSIKTESRKSNKIDKDIYVTASPILSAEGLSIEVFKNSHRQKLNDVTTESLLNDKAVLIKIQQLENELKVVNTKLQNDTKIIENLNNKICEAENNIREFCKQEFKVVRIDKKASEELDLRSNAKEHKFKDSDVDFSNEFKNGGPKQFEVRKTSADMLQSGRSSKNQFSNINMNKENEVGNRLTYKDDHTNIYNKRSKLDETLKTDYNNYLKECNIIQNSNNEQFINISVNPTNKKAVNKQQLNILDLKMQKENAINILKKLAESRKNKNYLKDKYNIGLSQITNPKTPTPIKLKYSNTLKMPANAYIVDHVVENIAKNKNYDEHSVSALKSLLDDEFDKDGVIIDTLNVGDEEKDDIIEDRSVLEADVVAENLLNGTTTTYNVEDKVENPFPEIDEVLGPLATDKFNLAS